MVTETLSTRTFEETAVTTPTFSVTLAQTLADIRACQRLRYLVFNCERRQGLPDSERSGLDSDRFDRICEHLMVHERESGQLVGTYRMQTGERAKSNLGYYSEGLFDLNSFEGLRSHILELGRACIREDYRNTTVLCLLWKGIARYAASCDARYLIGCSSISSQDESAGQPMYQILQDTHLAPASLRTIPHPHCSCRANGKTAEPPELPRLFRAYLQISARICGPPAIDRAFKTIDFLTLLDLHQIPPRVRSRFF